MRIRTLISIILLSISVCDAAAPPITGIATTWDGRPAANAETYLVWYQNTQGRSTLAGSGKTDERGRFSFPAPAASPDRAMLVVVRQQGYAVGLGASDLTAPVDLKIMLGKTTTERGQVVDSAGKPVPNAKVWMSDVIQKVAGGKAFIYCGLPDEIGRQWAATTDASGHFMLQDVSSDDSGRFVAEAAGFERGDGYAPDDGAPIAITLYRKTHIRGKLQLPSPPGGLQGIHVSRRVLKGPRRWVAPEPAPVGPDGAFVLVDVPPGDLQFRVASDPTSQWQAAGVKDVSVKEGQSVENLLIPVTVVKGTRVSGRVLDAATRAPISGAEIFRRSSNEDGDGEVGRTDAEGRYFFYAPLGEFSLHVSTAPEPYLVPWGLNERRVTVGSALTEVPAFTFHKGVIIKVQVVDEKGQPATGAVVGSIGGSFMEVLFPSAVNSLGAMMVLVDSSKPLSILAWTETAFSQPVFVDPAHLNGPVRIVVAEGNGASIRGMVVDDAGRPVAGAIVHNCWHEGDSTEFGQSRRTGADGMFEFHALPPILSFSLIVAAPDYVTLSTEKWQAAPGASHDFGKLVLRQLSGFLEGRVVDSRGAPAAGVRIWNGGRVVNAVETETDARGAFRLSGLCQGACFVFAEKEGWHLGGLLTRAPSSGIAITLYRNAETPPVSRLPARREDPAANRRFALAMLERARKENGGEDPAESAGVLYKLDRARAMAISDAEGRVTVMKLMARDALPGNPAEAISYLKQISDPEQMLGSLLELVESTWKAHPVAARALLTEALAAARGLPAGSFQTIYLAECGRWMQRLHLPGGLPLLRQAEIQARGFPLTGRDCYARGAIADQLCEDDLPAALALANPIQDEFERQRHLSNIAYRIAEAMPARAREILDSLPLPHPRPGLYQAPYRDRAAARLCCLLAPAHPQQAEAFALSIHDCDVQASAYLWMAEKLAVGDRQRALGYLQRGVDAMLPHGRSSDTTPGLSQGLSMVAALAQAAARMGDPRAHNMALRAVSLMRRSSQSPLDDDFDEVNRSLEEGLLAAGLAESEPEIARSLLEDAIPRTIAHLPGDGVYEQAIGQIAMATLELDPALCLQFLDRLDAVHRPFSKVSLMPLASLAGYAIGDAEHRRKVLDRAMYSFDPEESK